MAEIELEFCSSNDPRYVEVRKLHYIASLSFETMTTLTAVEREAKGMKFGDRGQQAHFLIWRNNNLAGIISGGGAVKCTRSRNEFFGVPMKLPKTGEPTWINGVVDNTVFCLTDHEKGFFGRVLSTWEKVVPLVWQDLYGVAVYGFETFIEPDAAVGRGKGLGYLDTGWTYVGATAGLAVTHPKASGMNQVEGKSTRVYGQTVPKNVFCKWRKGFSSPIWCKYASSWKATTPEEKRIAKEKSAARKRLMGARCFVVDAWRVSVGGVIRDARAEFRTWQKANQGTPEVPVAGPSQTAVAA